MGIGCPECSAIGWHDDWCPNHPSKVEAREEYEDEINELRQENTQLRSDLDTAMNKANELGDKLATSIEEITRLKARIKLLEAVWDNGTALSDNELEIYVDKDVIIERALEQF